MMGTVGGDRMLNLNARKEILKRASPKNLAAAFSKNLDAGSDDPLALPFGTMNPPPWSDTIAKVLTTQSVESRTQIAADAIAKMRARTAELNNEKATLNAEEYHLQGRLQLMNKCLEWADTMPGKLEKPDGSVFHKLKACWLTADILCDDKNESRPFFTDTPNIFVVEHDWARAFAGAEDFEGGEWPLPFDLCVFEFKISGKPVIALLMEDGGHTKGFICINIGGDYWSISRAGDMKLAPSEIQDKLHPLNVILHRNVRALCIALDAEVAVTELTRAPHRLNSIRERAGKLPLHDFHTVSLSHRSRVEALPNSRDEPSHRVRLHFRRGHWRHYEAHKTWIKWCLVGNPDLGFIDKHYRA